MNETNAKAPIWYKADEIEAAVRRGSFFHQGMTLEQSIAAHLQAAFSKGFDMGRRGDPTSEIARLRKTLEGRVMVWDDPSLRDFKVCDLCGQPESKPHTESCVLA